MKQEEKGKAFENMANLVLEELRSRHSNRVKIIRQLRLELYDGRLIIPDFDLHFRMHHGEERYLIECQDREHSDPEIADKIRTAKALSKRNKFIFVYRATIPEATKLALESGGVLVMMFNEFVDFIAKIDMNLSAIESQNHDEADKVLDAYSEWSPKRPTQEWEIDSPPPDLPDSFWRRPK